MLPARYGGSRSVSVLPFRILRTSLLPGKLDFEVRASALNMASITTKQRTNGFHSQFSRLRTCAPICFTPPIRSPSESRRYNPAPDGGSACPPSGSVAAASATRVIRRFAYKHAQDVAQVRSMALKATRLPGILLA